MIFVQSHTALQPPPVLSPVVNSSPAAGSNASLSPDVLSWPLTSGAGQSRPAHLLSKHEAKLGLIILLTSCPSLASVLEECLKKLFS